MDRVSRLKANIEKKRRDFQSQYGMYKYIQVMKGDDENYKTFINMLGLNAQDSNFKIAIGECNILQLKKIIKASEKLNVKIKFLHK